MMEGDESFVSLHDRATRGEALPADERERLEAWYARQDELESESVRTDRDLTSIEALRAQVHTAITQVQGESERLRILASQNEALRREIAVLQKRLTEQPAVRTA